MFLFFKEHHKISLNIKKHSVFFLGLRGWVESQSRSYLNSTVMRTKEECVVKIKLFFGGGKSAVRGRGGWRVGVGGGGNWHTTQCFGSGSGLGGLLNPDPDSKIRIWIVKKEFKNLNHHKIILLFRKLKLTSFDGKFFNFILIPGSVKEQFCAVILFFIQRQVFTAYSLRKLLWIIHRSLTHRKSFQVCLVRGGFQLKCLCKVWRGLMNPRCGDNHGASL